MYNTLKVRGMCFQVTVKDYENSQLVNKSPKKYSTNFDIKGNVMKI